VENMLDIVPTMAFAWWWLTGTPADITITFGPNANGGMQAVTSDLVAAGVQVASWSWGSAADTWDPSERAALSKVFAAAVASGICFCAAAGDNSFDDGTTTPCTDYPCSDPNVWAVGGTHLSLAADGSRASESAWGDGNPGDEGGGGGYDPTVPVPSWQAGVVPTDAPGRGVPDTAANADPNSGWQMSANGQWTVVGGTSASSPFTAALIAAAIGFAKATGKGLATPSIYAAGENGCFDITTGSNGDPATPGWDPATGLGTPRGANFTDALIAWAKGVAPTPAPTPSPSPTPPAPPPASPASVTLAQAQAWATQGVNTGGFFMTRTQAAARASSGLAENWPSSEET
ncbi:MAG TPA: S8 family serine peptidase, partial [Paraburkholderia sp.]|nr:S8 family serine peptidase [Paraburkholderia sp.]